MNSKWLLYIGILLLILGFILKRVGDFGLLPFAFIGLGVASKLTFLIKRWMSGKFRPGYELIFLIVGLGLFFTGLYVQHPFVLSNKYIFLPSGILLKFIFIFLMIKKSRQKKVLSDN